MKDLSHSHQGIIEELAAIGGESLAGSGFEAETPEPDLESCDQSLEE